MMVTVLIYACATGVLLSRRIARRLHEDVHSACTAAARSPATGRCANSADVISNELHDRDIVLIDCAPTESIFTQAAYHASRYILVPVKPEYFATIGFPLLNDSLQSFRTSNPSHALDVAGIVINNSTYHYSGNNGGPERALAISELRAEAKGNGWPVFDRQIPLSRGFPKMMRGNFSHLGDADQFDFFADEFFNAIGI